MKLYQIVQRKTENKSKILISYNWTSFKVITTQLVKKCAVLPVYLYSIFYFVSRLLNCKCLFNLDKPLRCKSYKGECKKYNFWDRT